MAGSIALASLRKKFDHAHLFILSETGFDLCHLAEAIGGTGILRS